MTELEREISTLTKDVAVVVNIQKTLQESQRQTTSNIDRLTENIQLLSHDAVYLKSLSLRIASLEETSKWSVRAVITTTFSTIGAVMYLLFKNDIG